MTESSPLSPPVVTPEHDRSGNRYEVLAPYPIDRRVDPFMLTVGVAFATGETEGGPSRIHVKLDALVLLGSLLQLGPQEGHFELVLEPEDLGDTVPIRLRVTRST